MRDIGWNGLRSGCAILVWMARANGPRRPRAPMETNLHPSLHARTAPDRIAYRMAESGETVTYRQLDEASNRFAQLLRASGIARSEEHTSELQSRPQLVCRLL